MKPAAILAALLADLKPWLATTHNCECLLAPGPATAVHQVVSAAPNKALVVIVWDGDSTNPAGTELYEEPIYDCGFSAFVKYSPGLQPDPGSHLVTDQPGGRPSLIGLCDAVRNRILTLPGSTGMDLRAAFKGSGEIIFAADGIPVPLEAYRLRFTRAYSPDAVTLRTV